MSDKAIKDQAIDAAPSAGTALEQGPEIVLSRPKYIYGFAVLYGLFLLDFAARLGVVTVFPAMQIELGFSDSQVGLIGSVVLMGMSLFVLPFSYLADKTSKKSAITIMSAMWGAGALLCGMASSFLAIVLGRLFVGMGNASYAPVSVSMLTSWTAKKRWGSTIGVYNSSMAMGMAVGTAVAGLLGTLYGWRVPFLIIGGLTLVFSFLSMTLPKGASSKAASKPKVNMKEAFNVTLQNKTLVLIGIGAGLCNLAQASLTAWRPMYLVRTLGWSSAEVGAILGPVYLLIGLCVVPFAGMLSDRLVKMDNRSRAWLAVPVFIATAGLNALAFTDGWFVGIVIGMMLVNLPFPGFHIGTQELVPSRYRASAYGTYVTFLQGIGFFGPVLTGGLSQAFGIDQALVYIQGGYVMAALCFLIAGFTYRSDLKKARELDNE